MKAPLDGLSPEKQTILDTVERHRDLILRINRDLYRHPELSGEETRSCRFLGRLLEDQNFRVRYQLADLPTAFLATRGKGGNGPKIAFLAEYDALPDIGHGCGHNLIAAAAIGAALAVADMLEIHPGEIQVIGTPAEETFGGKVILAEAGLFAGLDAVMMIHPAGENRVYTTSLAARTYQVDFLGKASHAVAHPEKGINALDALVELYRAAGIMAREDPGGARLPGVILEGGKRANLVPDRAVGEFSLRTPTMEGLRVLEKRFQSAVGEIAQNTGCQFRLEANHLPYSEMRTNRMMADSFKENLRILGETTEDGPRNRMGSLDMGNVSQLVPAIHPFIAICRPSLASHSREFAQATQMPEGEKGLLLAARALALTAADVLVSADLRRRIDEEFRRPGGKTK